MDTKDGRQRMLGRKARRRKAKTLNDIVISVLSFIAAALATKGPLMHEVSSRAELEQAPVELSKKAAARQARIHRRARLVGIGASDCAGPSCSTQPGLIELCARRASMAIQ